MKLTEVTALAIRILGILFFIRLSGSFASWYMAIHSLVEPALSVMSIIFSYILPILLALVAIKFPVSLAKLLVPLSSQPSQELESDGKSLQLAAFVILGVFILSRAITDFIYNALMIIALNNAEAQIDKYPYFVNEITTIVELIIGLYLVLGTNGILKLIGRLRNAGTP